MLTLEEGAATLDVRLDPDLLAAKIAAFKRR